MSTVVKSDETEEFLCHVAWLYYANGMTQSGIAEQLGVTRLRVNQALPAARRLGIVRIEISSPFAANLKLQDELCEKFGLRSACVAPADRQNYSPHLTVGTALAFFVEEGLVAKKWKSIGVSWGMTLDTAISRMKPMDCPDIDIVSMIGGTPEGASFNAFGIAAGFAQRINSNYSLFALPIYLDSQELVASLMASPMFQAQAKKVNAIDIALLVAGDLSDQSYMIRDGLPHDVSASELEKCGAVGDILGRFLNAQGEIIDHPINKRAVGMSLKTLKKCDHIALAAAGAHKVDIIKAAILGGYVHTLITDDVTAELLIR